MEIEEYIQEGLHGEKQNHALAFVRFLREKNLHFHRDTGPYWKDKVYYWVQQGDDCVCFIAIHEDGKDTDHWTVWSEDMDGLAEDALSPALCEIGWRLVDHCGHCGSCGGGRRKSIFGKVFDAVCGCTFRADNPSAEELEFLQAIAEMRMRERSKQCIGSEGRDT